MNYLQNETLSELVDRIDEVERLFSKKTTYSCFCIHDSKELIALSYELIRRLSLVVEIAAGSESTIPTLTDPDEWE